MGDLNMKVQDVHVGEWLERDNNERDILIKGAIIGLGRNLVLGKYQQSTRMTPARILAIVERVQKLAFPGNQIGDHHNSTVFQVVASFSYKI